MLRFYEIHLNHLMKENNENVHIFFNPKSLCQITFFPFGGIFFLEDAIFGWFWDYLTRGPGSIIFQRPKELRPTHSSLSNFLGYFDLGLDCVCGAKGTCLPSV